MKKTLMITSFALAMAGMTGATFAKSKAKSKSSKSSGTSSSSSTHTTTKPDNSKKPTTQSDKDDRMHKNKKMHRCKLPDGSTNPNVTQELCQKVGGQWTKY